MSDYEILTDSSANFSPELASQVVCRVAQLTVSIGDGEARPNQEVDLADFYRALREKIPVRTSAPSVGAFAGAIEEIFREGRDVLYVGFSSGLSGTYQAALAAAQTVLPRYPERRFVPVDSRGACQGEGLLVYLVSEEKKKGLSLDEAKKFAESVKFRICHWFTVDDLFFLKRGGRVSAATAVIGSMLSVKPILFMDREGKLINAGRVRGRRASLDALFEKVRDTATDPKNNPICISHGDCAEDASYLRDRLMRELGAEKVYLQYVGAVIGTHSGPGTLGVEFLGEGR